MAIHFKASGKSIDVQPKNGKVFSLEELQGYVEGLIELVNLRTCWLVVNEEGMIKGLPFNMAATMAYRSIGGDFIFGDALLCTFDQIE